MISHLSWKVLAQDLKYVVIDVNWVWYKVGLNTNLISSTSVWEDVSYWIFTNVKENELSLYWFQTKDELDFFEILIWVNWIWPKTALEILTLPLDTLKQACSTWDIEVFKQVKWIWQKAAERIVVELKSKIGNINISSLNISQDKQNVVYTETIIALEGLWFTRWEIMQKLQAAPNAQTAEEMVTWYLGN